jgi:hypothetical protein
MPEYANLTNGLLCAPSDAPLVRLPSTWCEQKAWDKVLTGLGADLYAHLARGEAITVHDQSERERQTRAQWQGLSWVRYACAVAWGLKPRREISRFGMDVTEYWADVYESLDLTKRGRESQRWLEYFRPVAEEAGTTRLELSACACYRRPWGGMTNGKYLLRRYGSERED